MCTCWPIEWSCALAYTHNRWRSLWWKEDSTFSLLPQAAPEQFMTSWSSAGKMNGQTAELKEIYMNVNMVVYKTTQSYSHCLYGVFMQELCSPQKTTICGHRDLCINSIREWPHGCSIAACVCVCICSTCFTVLITIYNNVQILCMSTSCNACLHRAVSELCCLLVDFECTAGDSRSGFTEPTCYIHSLL